MPSKLTLGIVAPLTSFALQLLKGFLIRPGTFFEGTSWFAPEEVLPPVTMGLHNHNIF